MNYIKIDQRLEQAIKAFYEAHECLDDVYQDIIDNYDPNEDYIVALDEHLSYIIQILADIKSQNLDNFSYSNENPYFSGDV